MPSFFPDGSPHADSRSDDSRVCRVAESRAASPLMRSDEVKTKTTGWLALATFLSAFAGNAVSAPSRDAKHDMDQLERQRRQEQIQKEIERERAITEQNRAPSPQSEAKDRPLQEASRFLVSEILLVGDDAPSEEVESILAARQGTVMGSAEIMALVRDLTNHYIKKGFVTTVVTVLPGKLSSGTLTLEVKWGTIKDITINGKPATGIRDKLRLFSAMPNADGKRLNMADIDQAVDNLLKGGGNDKIQIVPSDELGSSVLDVTTTEPRMLSFGVGVNNSGREVEGWNQYSASLGVNNLLGLNDTLSTYYAQQDFKDADNLQQIGSINYSLPIGYWTLDASWYGSRYEKAIDGMFGRYFTEGSSQRYNLKLSRMLHRDAQGKTSGYVKFGVRKNENAVEGQLQGTASKTYSEIGAGVTHVGTLFGGWVYGDLGISAGVPWMGGAWRDDPDLVRFDTNYTKVNGLVSWTRPFRIAGIDLQYELGTGFQYSENTMVNDARMSIGDEYTVRGFKDSVFYGDSGAYFSNTLSLPIRASALGGMQVTPFIGYDAGYVKKNGPDSKAEYVMGAAVGLRFASKYVTSSLSYGWPIVSPSQDQPLARALNYRLDLRY